ncbi:MAG: glycosyltransferase family 1 protein [Acidobacteriota bacterium]|nr:glycosyltransferase family 1 protein [Acidobacteriota bacterium]
MRIGVDARELCGRPTGVGRYLTELFTEWSNHPDAKRHAWTLYAHERPQIGAPWSDSVRVLAGSGGSAWEQWTLPRELSRDRPDVLFAPGYTAPLTAPAPTVLTVHDVSFFAKPEWFSYREGTRRRLLTAASARRARVVITDSMFSKSEIVKHIGLPEASIRVIPLGIRRTEPSSEPSSGTLVRNPREEPSPEPPAREPIVLYVGSVFARRRVDQLIASFDRVVDRVPSARLEIVGENRTVPHLDLEARRRQARHADRISIRSYVDEATLRDLYARASVFAFLSEYEGFGLTPLEALASGIPPVLLDTPIARETNGPAARYVPAANMADRLVDALSDCLSNTAARDAILQHAPGVLARYSWPAAAAATLHAIEEGAGVR